MLIKRPDVYIDNNIQGFPDGSKPSEATIESAVNTPIKAVSYYTAMTKNSIRQEDFRYIVSGIITNSSSQAISGASVVATSASLTFSTTTDTYGEYTLEVLRGSEDYSILFSKSGYSSLNVVKAITEDTTVNGVLTAQMTTGTLSGYIYDTATTCGIQYARVNIESVSAVFTDAAGAYSCSVPYSDTAYTLNISANHYSSASTTVTVNSATVHKSVGLTRYSCPIYGTIKNIYDEAISGASVQFEVSGNTYTAISDATGNYTITLMSNLYTVTCSKSGYVTSITSLDVTTAEMQYNIVLELDSTAICTVSGTITDACSSEYSCLAYGVGIGFYNGSIDTDWKYTRVGFPYRLLATDSYTKSVQYSIDIPAGRYTVYVAAGAELDSTEQELTISSGTTVNYTIREPNYNNAHTNLGVCVRDSYGNEIGVNFAKLNIDSGFCTKLSYSGYPTEFYTNNSLNTHTISATQCLFNNESWSWTTGNTPQYVYFTDIKKSLPLHLSGIAYKSDQTTIAANASVHIYSNPTDSVYVTTDSTGHFEADISWWGIVILEMSYPIGGDITQLWVYNDVTNIIINNANGVPDGTGIISL